MTNNPAKCIPTSYTTPRIRVYGLPRNALRCFVACIHPLYTHIYIYINGIQIEVLRIKGSVYNRLECIHGVATNVVYSLCEKCKLLHV